MIGGIFKVEGKMSQDNGLMEKLKKDGDIQFLMSGRCAISHCLRDYIAQGGIKSAYVPVYTCETVLAPFLQLGIELSFYDVDKNLQPVFDDNFLKSAPLVLFTGYYGVVTYSDKDLLKVKQNGNCIIQDITHTMLNDEPYSEYADYIAGSFRKWIGVASGGVAIKKDGTFKSEPISIHEEHLTLRRQALTMASESQSPDSTDKVFWNGEMLLREIFENQESDQASIDVITHFNASDVVKKRRENFSYLSSKLKTLKEIELVFPELGRGEIPSHLSIFSKDRDELQKYLRENKIKATVYWPKGPAIPENKPFEADYIFNNILSLPIDQRYSFKEMDTIFETIASFLSK